MQEATDIYKALLLEHRDLLALNVYVALCYAKLDYYDVNSEILQVRQQGQQQPCYRADVRVVQMGPCVQHVAAGVGSNEGLKVQSITA